MLVYYQDFGSSSPYRIQNYPASLAVLDRQIHSKPLPRLRARPAAPPPPPPGGVAPKTA